MTYHTPVLLNACIQGLALKPEGTYVDVTFGGGGHSREILRHLGPEGKLIAFDQDPDARANVPDDPRLIFVPANFRFIRNYLSMYNLAPVDGILADLGVSSHQFDTPEKGFSLRFDAPLDMRMNPSLPRSAYQILMESSEEQLRSMFREYGELPEAGKLARHLINARNDRKPDTTGKLLELIRPFMRKGQEHQFAARVFQSFRIEVNQEMDVLKEFLLQTPEILKPGGRLVIMSYHSLEDRLVKNFLRSGKFEGEADKDLFGRSSVPFHPENRKPIRPDAKEIDQNNRARSALLRIATRNEI
jgi:16S rRNA (cytosine1402-N4)-methyltransferase